MHACTHACVHAYMHTYTCSRLTPSAMPASVKHTRARWVPSKHACMHAYMYTCIHAHMHTYMHTCITYASCGLADLGHTYMHAYILYICTYIHMHIHVCMFLCIHSHTVVDWLPSDTLGHGCKHHQQQMCNLCLYLDVVVVASRLLSLSLFLSLFLSKVRQKKKRFPMRNQ